MNEKNNEKKRGATRTNEPFFIVPNKVFEYGLGPYELSILFYLCKCADKERHTCYPSERGIADACGMSLSTAKRSVRALEEKELINIEKQFSKSKNGFNRQTSNFYTLRVYGTPDTALTDTPVKLCETPTLAHADTPPSSVGHPPQFTQTREINKTKPIITKSNITIPTEQESISASEVEKERISFLELKRECFEELKRDYSLEEDYLLLLDRAIDYLWHKENAEYEGKIYAKEEVCELISTKMTPKILASCIEDLRHSKAPVRMPVPYLAKCLLGGLLHPEISVPSGFVGWGDHADFGASASATSSNEWENGQAQSGGWGNGQAQNGEWWNRERKDQGNQSSSFDIDEFFELALRKTYGEG